MKGLRTCSRFAWASLVACTKHATPAVEVHDAAAAPVPSVAASDEAATPERAAVVEAAALEPPLMETVASQGTITCPMLAVDGERALYVTSNDDWKLEAIGANAPRVVGHLDFHGNEQCGVVADADAFYVVYGGMLVPTGRDGQLFRIDRKTQTFKRLFHTPHHQELRLVASSERLLYVTGEEKVVRAITKDGSSAETFAALPEVAFAIAATPTTLLVSTCEKEAPKGCAVLAFDETTKAMRRIRDHVGAAYAIVADGETAWIPDDDDGSLTRVDVATGAATKVATVEHVRGLAADATWIYATSYVQGALVAVRKADGKTVQLATGLSQAQAVAVTGGEVFVLTDVPSAGSSLPITYETPYATGAVLLRGSKSRLFARAIAPREKDAGSRDRADDAAVDAE